MFWILKFNLGSRSLDLERVNGEAWTEGRRIKPPTRAGPVFSLVKCALAEGRVVDCVTDLSVAHQVCQWTAPGVPEAMGALRAKRTAAGGSRPWHATVYDNGVPIIEAPWERLRSQALDVCKHLTKPCVKTSSHEEMGRRGC